MPRYLPPGSSDFDAFTSAEAGTRFSDPKEMQEKWHYPVISETDDAHISQK